MKNDLQSNSLDQKPLTDKQKNILDFIKRYIAENNYAPSIREIGDNNGLSSSATVHTYINVLVEKGWLKKNDYKFRTLEVVGENEYINKINGIYSLVIVDDNKNYKEQLLNPMNKLSLSKDLFDIDSNSFIINITNSNLFNKNDLVVVKKTNKYKEDDLVVISKDNMIIIEKYNTSLTNIIGKVSGLIRKY